MTWFKWQAVCRKRLDTEIVNRDVMNKDILMSKGQDTEEHWISISDMMAGLMIIFLFIAISYMLHAQDERDEAIEEQKEIEEIVLTYKKLKVELIADLEEEFENDLETWNAVLNKQTLSIRFKEPEVLFELGKAEVRPLFKRILDDFFPRYIRTLRRPEYKNDIAEIRIEGHTSSEWTEGISPEAAYIRNMELSQDRTRSVLEYVLQIPLIKKDKKVQDWLTRYLTANGLSSSQLITDSNDGKEIREESRRVEFRVRTNADKQIDEIIERIIERDKKE